MRRATLTHQFVQHVPDKLEDGVVYVSIEFATAIHKCMCGCGQEVVIVLSPTDWRLIFDGESISLDPSIGNWGFPCRSHYWITRNRVRWAEVWSDEQIERGRAYDRKVKSGASVDPESSNRDVSSLPGPSRSMWSCWFGRR